MRSRSLVLHTTWGSGNASALDATEVFTSFHVTSLRSMSRNGSIENCPRPTSIIPSSLINASALSRSTPITVQYDCSLRNGRG